MKLTKKLITFALAGVMILSTAGVRVKGDMLNPLTATDRAKEGFVPTLNKIEVPKNLKVYRSTEAALIEWDKVEGAKTYKIYRKQSGKSYKYLSSVTEKSFIGMQNHKATRFYVDIRYKKKNKRYLYNKKYTYKVVAVGNNSSVKSQSTYTSKKWKKKKVEPSYYTLYYVNKKRAKEKKAKMYWGHHYEKGSKIRVNDLPKRSKQILKLKKQGKLKWTYTDLDHKRPVKNYWGTSPESAYSYLRLFNPYSLNFYDSGCWGENIGYSSDGTKDILDAYMKSSGHRYVIRGQGRDREVCTGDVQLSSSDGYMYLSKGDVGYNHSFSLTAYTLSDNLLSGDDLTYHQMYVAEDEYVVSTDYETTYSKDARRTKDVSIKLPSNLVYNYKNQRIFPTTPINNYYAWADDYKKKYNPSAVNELLDKAYNPQTFLEGYFGKNYETKAKRNDIKWDNVYQMCKVFYAAHGVDLDKALANK